MLRLTELIFFLLSKHTFGHFFKYHVVFQDQSEEYIAKDYTIDMIEVIGL